MQMIRISELHSSDFLISLSVFVDNSQSEQLEKMIRKNLVFLLFFVTISLSRALEDIECRFHTKKLVYYCDAYFNHALSEGGIVREVKRDHIDGMTDASVHGFVSTFSVVNNFPANLEAFFPSLKSIKIENANLSRIDGTDLRPFGDKLKELGLFNNSLEEIDADLFEFAPNLKTIDLSSNNIKFVGKDAFAKLKYLQTLRFQGNSCLSNDDLPLDELIKEIERSCKPIESTVS